MEVVCEDVGTMLILDEYMQLRIFYQSCDFYESFLQFNSNIKREKSVQKAEQLMVAKYFSRIKGILGVFWTIIIGYMM